MTTEAKKKQRIKRTVRFHAVRAGDELYASGKWWIVKEHGIPPGAKFTGIDPKTMEPAVEIIRDFSPDKECAVHVTRGRMGSCVVDYRNRLVQIIRTR